jgi:hypothetical protein
LLSNPHLRVCFQGGRTQTGGFPQSYWALVPPVSLWVCNAWLLFLLSRLTLWREKAKNSHPISSLTPERPWPLLPSVGWGEGLDFLLCTRCGGGGRLVVLGTWTGGSHLPLRVCCPGVLSGGIPLHSPFQQPATVAYSNSLASPHEEYWVPNRNVT